MFRKTNDLCTSFIETARTHLGYQSRPNQQSFFGGKVGYTGNPWAGAFIDVVAREAGLALHSCVYTPTGMAEFISNGRWHSRPRPGDIVFFSFTTGAGFDMPHCGIVTKTDDWDTARKFATIEGQVDSGLFRASTEATGVFERTRYGYEVIGFGRPAYRAIKESTDDGPALDTIRMSWMRPAQGKRSPDVERVQLALVSAAGLRKYKPGTWDGPTKSAYTQYQRRIGYVGDDVTGMPDKGALERLGRETKLFTVHNG